jgi:hypothetical protein
MVSQGMVRARSPVTQQVPDEHRLLHTSQSADTQKHTPMIRMYVASRMSLGRFGVGEYHASLTTQA